MTMVMRGGGSGGSRNRLSWTAVCSRHRRPSTEQGQLSSRPTHSDRLRVNISYHLVFPCSSYSFPDTDMGHAYIMCVGVDVPCHC